MHNMPFGTAFNAPVLKAEDAYDVAAYINSHKRAEKANLDRLFARRQEPMVSPASASAQGLGQQPSRSSSAPLAAISRSTSPRSTLQFVIP